MKFMVLLAGFYCSFRLLGVMTIKGVISPDSQNTNAETASLSFLKVGRGQIWADCELFGTVGTQTSFKQTSGNFDELYNTGNFNVAYDGTTCF